MAFARAFVYGLFGSIAVNLLLLFLFGAIVLDPEISLHALSVPPITIFTVLGVIGATAVYALMRKLLPDPDRPFMIVAAAVLVLSFIPDVLIVGQKSVGGNLGSAGLLMVMHVATCVVITWALTRLWGSASRITRAQGDA